MATPAWDGWLPAMLRHSTYRVACVVARSVTERLRRASAAADVTVFFSRHHSLRADRQMADALPGPCVAQTGTLIDLAFDKSAMARRALAVPGLLAIPEWTPDQAREALMEGRVPAVVAKAPDGTAGEDLRIYTKPDALLGAGVRAYEAGFILQPFVAGDELSITLAWHDGRCRAYPAVSKGPTQLEGAHPTSRTRVCPAPDLSALVWEEMVAACMGYLYPFRPQGLVEVELIVTKLGVYLLDVNPRLAATLRLTAAVASSSPLHDLMEAAAGLRTLDGVATADQYGEEWPATHLDEQAKAKLNQQEGVWASTRVTVVAQTKEELKTKKSKTAPPKKTNPPAPPDAVPG